MFLFPQSSELSLPLALYYCAEPDNMVIKHHNESLEVNE